MLTVDLERFKCEYERIRAMRLSDDELREMERRVRREMHELVRQRRGNAAGKTTWALAEVLGRVGYTPDEVYRMARQVSARCTAAALLGPSPVTEAALVGDP